jgi:nicotinamide-nucleotide amidase
MVTKRIEIIAIGDEVLRGETRGNNAAWIGRSLARAGLEVRRETELPDDLEALAAEFRAAAARSDAVVATGGLGPTVDDVTKGALIRAFGLDTVFREDIVRGIEARLAERGRTMHAGYRDQGRVPTCAAILENDVGLAVGLRVPVGGCEFFLLPGVPAEMEAMFSAAVLPALGGMGEDFAVKLRTFGLTESEAEDLVRTAVPEAVLRGVSIISSPKGVDLYFARAGGSAHAAAAERALGSRVYEVGDRSLEEVVVGLLLRAGKTVAAAESFTGGLLASAIVSVSGASGAFREGIVAYGNESKIERLGVARKTIESRGAVSIEACVEMARGERSRAGADFALATTGIAGPTGAAPGKPVGLCYVGCAGPEGTFAGKFLFPGDRETIRVRAAYHALDLLRLALIGAADALAPYAVEGA